MNTTLTPGSVRNRPFAQKSGLNESETKPRSQAHGKVEPLSPYVHSTQRFQPLPQPLGEAPYHFDLESVVPGISATAQAAGKLTFHTVGDTGCIKSPEYQESVVKAMIADLKNGGVLPSFFYHLGDVVYYNGEVGDYYDQFYEPYDAYTAPILAIPGNHDGDPKNASQTSLDGWVRYFMTEKPHIDPISKDAPRVTLSLPNVYYTLECPFVTIVGMYTNIPEHGSVDTAQQQWLTNELATAPKDKALIVSLHHPIYSFDVFHSGSAPMAAVLQHAINDSRRVPNMVLTAHVHNIQRIEKKVGDATIPFFVAGNGGYYHLHALTADKDYVDQLTGAKLIFADDKSHGYMTLSVDAENISGTITLVDKTTEVATVANEFEYSASAILLADNIVVTL